MTTDEALPAARVSEETTLEHLNISPIGRVVQDGYDRVNDATTS